MTTQIKNRKVDSYSILIVAKYFQCEQDYLNIIQVCKNYKKTLKKFRYNPIPIINLKLFPLIQTQYIYYETEKRIPEVNLYKICYPVSYSQYLEYQEKEKNVKYSKIYFDEEDVENNYTGTFPEIVHEINFECFKRNKLIKSIKIPTQITKLGLSCFSKCEGLKEIELNENIKELPLSCFEKCKKLTKIIIPSSVTKLSEYCFCKCYSLEQIEIPDSVKIIEHSCFFECTKLEKIKLPKNLKSIQSLTFYNCKSLKELIIPTSVKYLKISSIDGCNSLTKLIIPDKCKDGFIDRVDIKEELEIKIPINKYGICEFSISFELYELLKKDIYMFEDILGRIPEKGIEDYLDFFLKKWKELLIPRVYKFSLSMYFYPSSLFNL